MKTDVKKLDLAENEIAEALSHLHTALQVINDCAFTNCVKGTYRRNVITSITGLAMTTATALQDIALPSIEYLKTRLNNAPSSAAHIQPSIDTTALEDDVADIPIDDIVASAESLANIEPTDDETE